MSNDKRGPPARRAKMTVRHVGTGPHGFPLLRVESDGKYVADVETADPAAFARELEMQARADGHGFAIDGPLPRKGGSPDDE